MALVIADRLSSVMNSVHTFHYFAANQHSVTCTHRYFQNTKETHRMKTCDANLLHSLHHKHSMNDHCQVIQKQAAPHEDVIARVQMQLNNHYKQ